MQKRKLKICKKISAIVIILLLCAEVFAHGGMFSGEKKLRVLKTQWFDIIYPERCQVSATILYEKADDIYDEVTAQYGLRPAFRMPLIITPAVDQFNAFWTAVPYNHIAIYDTGTSGASELAVFSETLLSTFRHELTHAVTFNMKNGFWRVMGKVFGDEFAPGMLAVTTGMAEGATVVSESTSGEGRLNDEYAKHYVKQAKIEGQFPSYHDVSGASDVSPGGAPYYFNGAFHDWLQKKYGMEAYVEFWYRVVNGKNITITGAFKKSFGVKLKKAWKAFAEDYEVPELAANPVKSGEVLDFFQPELKDYSELNKAGSLYGSLNAGGNRLIWTDRFGGRVFLQEGEAKAREIFSMRGLTGARLSSDGRFIAASYLSDGAATIKGRVKIYDIERHSFYTVKDEGLKEAALLAAEEGYYLIAQKYFNQKYSIVIYKLELKEDGSSIRACQLIKEITFNPETNPYAFTPLSDGTFAWLKKEGLNYSLCISGVDGSLLNEFVFPQGMVVHSLSSGPENDFYFSYARKGTLPRAGRLQIGQADTGSSALLYLGSFDISGGIFDPVWWKGKIVYTGEFYRQNRLLILKDDEYFTDRSLSLASGGKKNNLEREEEGESLSDLQNISGLSKAYNPLPYIIHGILIPIGSYSPEFIGPRASDTADYLSYRLGASYITASPWTSGAGELFVLTSGWDFKTDTAGLSLQFNKGTDTSLFQTQTEVKSEFDARGWKQGGGSFTASSSIGIGNNSKITLSNKATALFGIEKEYFYSLQDVVSLTYSNARKAGPGRYENRGLALSVSYGRRIDESLSGPETTYVDISVLSAAGRLYIPHLLPFESQYSFTYNFPLTLSVRVLPSSSNYAFANVDKDTLGRAVFDASVETIVFSADFQRALPGITAVYLNDLYMSAGYAASGTAGSTNYGGFQTSKIAEYFKAVGDGRGYYLDSVYIKAGAELTPNIGVFSNSAYKINIYYVYSFTINTNKELKPIERIGFTLGLDMNF